MEAGQKGETTRKRSKKGNTLTVLPFFYLNYISSNSNNGSTLFVI